MAKKNNVIEEIQELIQQIKNEYQEGVDYKFVGYKEFGKNGTQNIRIFSPHLKKICREKFNFPLGVVKHLNYVKIYEIVQ